VIPTGNFASSWGVFHWTFRSFKKTKSYNWGELTYLRFVGWNTKWDWSWGSGIYASRTDLNWRHLPYIRHTIWPEVWYSTSILGSWNSHWTKSCPTVQRAFGYDSSSLPWNFPLAASPLWTKPMFPPHFEPNPCESAAMLNVAQRPCRGRCHRKCRWRNVQHLRLKQFYPVNGHIRYRLISGT